MTHPPTCCPSLRQLASLRRFFWTDCSSTNFKKRPRSFLRAAENVPVTLQTKPESLNSKISAHVQYLLLPADLHRRRVRTDFDHTNVNFDWPHVDFSFFVLFEGFPVDDRQRTLGCSRDSVELQIKSHWWSRLAVSDGRHHWRRIDIRPRGLREKRVLSLLRSGGHGKYRLRRACIGLAVSRGRRCRRIRVRGHCEQRKKTAQLHSAGKSGINFRENAYF